MATKKTAPEHSAKFQQVKDWYDNGHWTKKMVRNAVSKGWITEEECVEIIGE